jgi:hypothetical protein
LTTPVARASAFTLPSSTAKVVAQINARPSPRCRFGAQYGRSKAGSSGRAGVAVDRPGGGPSS